MSLTMNTEHISPTANFILQKKAFLSFLYTINSIVIYENSATTRTANQLTGTANQFQNCVAVTAYYC